MSTIGNTAAAARDTVDEFLDNTESKFAGAQAAVRPAAQVDSMPPLSGGSGDDNDNNSSGMNLEEMARSIGINCDIVSHIRYFSDVEGSHLSYQIHHPSSLLFFAGPQANASGFAYDDFFNGMIEKKKKDNSYRYFNSVNR